MVTHSRTSLRPGADADQLKPLYPAVPVSVTADAQLRPVVLTINGQRRRVVKIEDDWLIEDEWWRSPIHRVYHDVVLETGVRQTVFHDVVGDAWYLQEDPYPLADFLQPPG